MSILVIKDYKHSMKVTNEFRMANMGDYHDLHLKTDALLFEDVLETFRNMCLECYRLDPSHYFSSPGRLS